MLLGRIIGMLVTMAITVVLLSLCLVNKQEIALILDPFNPASPALTTPPIPLFLWLIAMLVMGVVLGGTASWLSQGKWRRTARRRTQEAMRWKAEAERLTRERDERVTDQKRLLAS